MSTNRNTTNEGDQMTDAAAAAPGAPTIPPPSAAAPPPWAAPPPYAGYTTPAAPRLIKNPVAAGWLSVLPGAGHVYLGLYQRAITFFLVWVVIMSFAERNDVGAFGMLIPFWWIFVLLDAVRQAKAINALGAAEPNLFPTEANLKMSGSLFLGVLLILFGVFFTLEKYVNIDLSFLVDNAPLLLVAFGAWQVFLYYRSKKEAEVAEIKKQSEGF